MSAEKRIIKRETLLDIFRKWRAGEPYPEAIGNERCAVSEYSDSYQRERAIIIEECVQLVQTNHSKIGHSWNGFQAMAQDGARQAAERIAKELRELKDAPTDAPTGDVGGSR